MAANPKGTPAAFFDLDRTLMEGSSAFQFGRAAYRAGLLSRRQLLADGWANLMFRLRGQYNGTILLEEPSTKTLWSPFTGVALTGALRGSALQRFPVLQCLWSEWLEMHPTTGVLYADQAARGGHGREYTPGSPGVGPSFAGTPDCFTPRRRC